MCWVFTKKLWWDAVFSSKLAATIPSNIVRLRSGPLLSPPRSLWPFLALLAFHLNARNSHLCQDGTNITAPR